MPILNAQERVELAINKIAKARQSTEDQLTWLAYIKEHLIENLAISEEDFETMPIFERHGGLRNVKKIFEDDFNVLFSDEAGDVFKYLMEDCNLHTVLRLPNGTFTPYSQGVKANVIFFQKGLPTENTWIYDCRTNIPGVTKKNRPLTPEMFAEFEKFYGKDPNGQSRRRQNGEDVRFHRFPLSQIKERNYNLDITWLKDENFEDPNSLPEPHILAGDAIMELNACVNELQAILDLIDAEEVE